MLTESPNRFPITACLCVYNIGEKTTGFRNNILHFTSYYGVNISANLCAAIVRFGHQEAGSHWGKPPTHSCLTLLVNTCILTDTSAAKHQHYHWFTAVFLPGWQMQVKYIPSMPCVGLSRKHLCRLLKPHLLPASGAIRCKSCAWEFSNMKVTSLGNYTVQSQH